MSTSIREVVGVFFDDETLKSALADLKAEDFTHDEIGLLAGEHTVKESLGDLYDEINDCDECENSPKMAFVKKDSVGDTYSSLSGGLSVIGATSAMGAIVASAGILGGALVAAASGAVAVAGVGALVTGLIYQSDAEYLNEQVEKGHLLLFVRADDTASEEKAIKIMASNRGYNPKAYKVAA